MIDRMLRTSLPHELARAAPRGPAPDLSLVAPAKDEAENLRPLLERVREAFEGRDLAWELLLVDDGSSDGTDAVIRELVDEDPRVVGVLLARNHGQSAATAAGVALARAPLVATLDADLQNDPRDLPRMLDALGEHDAVVGYRTVRRDSFVRRASSRIANAVRDRLSGDSIRDTGCALKLFRASALHGLPRFEGMHRFLPTLVRLHGGSVVEVPVSHHPRVAGKSKYGIRNRALRAFVDLLAVRWMRSRAIRLAVAEVVAEPPTTVPSRTVLPPTVPLDAGRPSCSNGSSPPSAGSASPRSSRASSSSGSRPNVPVAR